MPLTEEQQLEMYRNVGIIANNCIFCKKTQDDHEKRIRFLEQKYWVFFGIACCVGFIVNLCGLYLIKTYLL